MIPEADYGQTSDTIFRDFTKYRVDIQRSSRILPSHPQPMIYRQPSRAEQCERQQPD